MNHIKIFSHLSEIHSNKAIFLVAITVLAGLIIDISLNRIYSYGSASDSLSGFRIPAFLVLGIVYAIGQYLVLQFVKNKSKQIRAKQQLHLTLLHRTVTIIQYALTAIIIFFILEMILTSSYSLEILTAAIGISYSLAMVMLSLLAQRFFSWFRSNRNSVVGFYGLSSAMLAINAAFTFALVGLLFLFFHQPYVYAHLSATFVPFITSSLLAQTLNYAYAISSVLSFMISWVATILILRHYSSKLGVIKYWVIVGLPLPYFFIQFLPFFPNIVSIFSQSATTIFLFYTFIPTYSKAIGGILFGIAFWAAARNLGRNSVVKEYMTISAFGLVLLFVSNQGILLLGNVPYPPFGLVTVSFIGLSSYMVLVGIYCSAISISQDSDLRKSIRNFAMKESRLLDSIGAAHMEQEIQKSVLTLTKQNQDRMAEESGIHSSLTEDDMKFYLQEVISEIQKGRQQI